MYNFQIDTTNVENKEILSEENDCYVALYIQDSQIAYRIRCDKGKEVDMAVLLASIQTKECYDTIFQAIDDLENADEIYENHSIVMDALEQNAKPEEFDEDDLAPMMHPVCVHNNADEALFKDNK